MFYLVLVSHNKNLSSTAMWVMFSIGLLCIVIGLIVFFLFKNKIKRERIMTTEHFLLKPKKVTFQVFAFWGNVLYVFLIFVALIAAIVLLGVAISSMF